MIRISWLLAVLCCSASSIALAYASNEKGIHCAAYYELLSVVGDQPDISRKQSSKAFYALLKRAGDTQEAQDAVAQKMVDIGEEIPGPMTPASTAKLRGKYDAECKPLMKAAWCEVYEDPTACEG
ncbi:hypothetical protein [Pseudomonas sp. LB1P83]